MLVVGCVVLCVGGMCCVVLLYGGVCVCCVCVLLVGLLLVVV